MASDRPQFERPPVREVACALYFERIPIESTWVGALWSEFQADLPLAEDAPRHGPPSAMQRVMTFEIPMVIPGAMPRVLFLSQDERRLVQVQDDRFCFNWRRRSENDPYPEYDSVRADFDRHRATFERFASDVGWELHPTLCELTYINAIDPQLLDGGGLGALHRIFPRLGTLTSPASVGWNALFDLPDGLGRLQVLVVAQSANEPIRFDLVARGPYRADWFDRAHDAIGSMFLEMTSDLAKHQWAPKGAK